MSCGDLSNYESATGILNFSQFDLGYILLLNTQVKSVNYVRALDIPNSERTSTAPKTTTEEFNSELTFSFTGDLPVPSVQASIEAAVRKRTELQITNAERTSIKNVLQIVNGQNDLKNLMRGLGPNSRVIIVHSIVPAESISLLAKDATSGSAGTQILKYGDYTVNVSYQCNETLKQMATNKKAAMFYKAEALRYNAKTGKIEIDDSFPIALKEYNWRTAVNYNPRNDDGRV